MLCKLLRAAAENIVITKNHIMSTTVTVQHILYYEFPITNYAVSRASCPGDPFCSVWRCCSPEVMEASAHQQKRNRQQSEDSPLPFLRGRWEPFARVLFPVIRRRRHLGLFVSSKSGDGSVTLRQPVSSAH